MQVDGEKGATESTRLHAAGWAAVGIGSLLLIFGGPYLAHARRALDRWVFNDDARIGIFPFYRYVEPAAWQGDLLGDYALAITPVGPRLLYTLSAYVWDPYTLSKVLPYLLIAVTVAGVATAAWRLAGAPGAWLAACLVLSSPLYLERTGGGLPRAFGFPIVAWGLAALVHGRVRGALALTAVGALFYPTAGVALGAMTAAVLFALPTEDQGEGAGWAWKRRLGLLVATAALGAALIAPTWVATRAYGARITPDMLEQYPEAGPGGTHSAEDRPPYDGFLPLVLKEARRGLLGAGPSWVDPLRRWVRAHEWMALDLLLLTSVLGFVALARRRRGARRLAVALFGAFVAHLLARALAPHLYAPSRFVTYVVPPWCAVMVPAGLVGLLDVFGSGRALTRRLPDGLRRRLAFGGLDAGTGLGLAAAGILLMGLFGGRGHPTKGMHIQIGAKHAPLYEAIAALPPTAKIAGWPDDPMSNVPLISRRQALITGETHIALHVGYVETLRPRVHALIAGYLAADRAPLEALRDEWGVTHLLIDKRRLRGSSPVYMKPFDETITQAQRLRRGRKFELRKQLQAFVHTAGHYVLVDLSKLR